MTPVEGACLRAVYASPDREFADVENVLLYNIGAGSYRHLARSGLEVFRTVSPDAYHRVSYELADSPTHAPRDRAIATVSIDELPALRDKPGAWWIVMREKLEVHLPTVGREFSVDVLVRDDAAPFVSWIKPMLDGFISALHAHDQTNRNHILSALARYGDPKRLWVVLNDPVFAVLGTRTLVRPHRSGIAWNPADDRCNGFSIKLIADGPALYATIRSFTR